MSAAPDLSMEQAMSNAVQKTENTNVAAMPTMDQMVALAYEQADVDKLAKFMELKERHEATEARKAAYAAMAEFKRNPPRIDKVRKGHNAKYAGHCDVTMPIAGGLAQHGLTHTWSMTQDKGAITVRCTIAHELGFEFPAVEMSSAYDGSGGKNPIQSIASAKTYLERYTLLAATGLSTADMPDDDGQASGDTIERVTPEQAIVLGEYLSQMDPKTRSRAMTYLKDTIKCDDVANLRADLYEQVATKFASKIPSEKKS